MIKKGRTYHKTHHNTGADRYLITYADLITLLLGLFVVLYSTTQVDQEKFKEYAAAFSGYFKTSDSSPLDGGSGVLEGMKDGVPEAILPEASSRNMQEISDELEEKLATFIEAGGVAIERNDSGFKLIMQEKLLFPSGKAELVPEGSRALDSISSILSNWQLTIEIDGHTDNVPIKTFQYESNWHLSSARAVNVAYSMIRKGVPDFNLVIRGFGPQRPIADNISPEGKARNRRVEINIGPLTGDMPSTDGYKNNQENEN